MTFFVPTLSQGWLERAYLWLRRWAWVPIGFIILVVGFFLGGFALPTSDKNRRNPFRQIKNAIDRNNQEIDAEVCEAEIRRKEELKRIEREYQREIKALDGEQQKKYEYYKRNPQKLAAWLTRLAQD